MPPPVRSGPAPLSAEGGAILSRPVHPGLTTLENRIGRICGIIDENKGEEIAVLDLRGLSDFTDAFVIATVRSRTHMQGITQHLADRLRGEGLKPLGKPDLRSERWSLLDYGDVVVHLFDVDSRAFYGLEQLWGDAREIVWQQLAMA
jgi:ribosome-associated protein